MSIDLTNREQIAGLDHSGVLASIEQLPDQIQDAWNQTANQDNHAYAQGINHVVVSGMGGSTLGAHVIQSIAKAYLKVPFEIVKDYTLPAYVDDKTLVILSSYSGTTEETLSAAKDAQNKGVKIAVIAAGGPLADLAGEHNYPSYIMQPKYNPSNQPRMAIGYAIAGQIGLLKSFGLINSEHFPVDATISFLRENAIKFAPETPHNQAMELAESALNRIIYLISAEHLTGSTHVINNQLNENAKHLTVELQLPELNHHYLEGLPHPESAKDGCIFWFVNSALYSPKLQLRLELTQDVVTKNNFPSKVIQLTAQDPFIQAFELIQLGAYTNFYLSMLHGIDPAPIPWVDYFKGQLKSRQPGL